MTGDSPYQGLDERLDRLMYPILLLTGAALCADVVVAATWGRDPVLLYIREIGFATVWTAVGYLAWRLRLRRRMGLLMTAMGLLLALNMSAGFGLDLHDFGAALVYALMVALTDLQTPVGAHLLLAFPSGRLLDTASRRLIVCAYGYAAMTGLATLLVLVVEVSSCGHACPGSWPDFAPPHPMRQMIETVGSAGWLPMSVVFAVLLIRRIRRASRRERRVLIVPFTVAAVTSAAFVGRLVVAVAAGQRVYAGSSVLILIIHVGGLIAVPLSFLLGLLRERLSYAGVGELVRTLRDVRSDHIGKVLATTLDDPALRLVFPVDQGLVDDRGQPAALPSPGDDRMVTPIGDPAAPLALVVHDPSLADEPILPAASAAARLALENARLTAQIHAQVADLQASRARLVAASDTVRRRLERDLHDGIQQWLVSLGLALQLLRMQLDTTATSAHKTLDDAERELTEAINELRRLAAGIHPAVLTDRGLPAALEHLAAHSPVPVHTQVDELGRFPENVESTVYFCASEVITNAVKHAHATTITVYLTHRPGRLVLSVTDDGIGGADPRGAGLRGLADRLAIFEGTLTIRSPQGTGTQITAELPCASSSSMTT